MEKKVKGWVVINNNHPNNPDIKQIYHNTFAYSRKDCIKLFIEGVTNDWKYWYRKYNFRAVKAEMTINVLK